MSINKFEDRNIRKLTKTSRGSYFVRLPVEYIRELGWQDKQKVEVELNRRSKKLVIKDWEK